jgi:hypothetical protein
VIRTSVNFSSSNSNVIFSLFRSNDGIGRSESWQNSIALTGVDGSMALNATNNAFRHTLDVASFGKAATFAPSAFSVQIMNPGALASTDGMVFAGVMKSAADLGGDTRTWDALGKSFISYQAPRMMAAGKLALRGVQVNSYPLNMAAISDFLSMGSDSDGLVTWTESADLNGCGFAPIYVHTTEAALKLNYLVTVEWRVRFDFSHPAASGHVHHPVASDSTWDRVLRTATSLGSGVLDIAEVVANNGEALGRAAALMRGA